MSEWWCNGVLYQVYVRSFADSNGDGIGDLRGVAAHLDHLEWLGVDAIWLSPTFPSPNHDWGYDVSDYYGVHPDYGTLDDLDALVREAGARGIRVLLDLVPNHTSIEHPWFVDARSSRTARHRDWYVWADSRPDGSPPNNWVSMFLGSAWTFDEDTGQWYLASFLPEQPDLNWWNPEVRAEFDRILRHWFDRGIAGFRIDVAHMIVKDRELRDNPPATEHDTLIDQLRGQVPIYSSNRPEVHDVHRHWREVAEAYDPARVLVGETYVERVQDVVAYYGRGDELQLAFNIPFLNAPFAADTLRGIVDETLGLLPEGCTALWTGSNHDGSRLPTRWAKGDVDAARCALLMLLTLPGTTCLYYGDEIGMPDTDVPRERLVDPVSIALAPVHNRDVARTPMPWSAEPGAGFTSAVVEPWLPFGDVAACNVADQRADPSSTLHLVRDLIALRRELPALRDGDYRALDTTSDPTWAWQRGDDVFVALNLGDAPAHIEGVRGTIRVCTNRERDGEAAAGALQLGPREAAVVLTSEGMRS